LAGALLGLGTLFGIFSHRSGKRPGKSELAMEHSKQDARGQQAQAKGPRQNRPRSRGPEQARLEKPRGAGQAAQAETAAARPNLNNRKQQLGTTPDVTMTTQPVHYTTAYPTFSTNGRYYNPDQAGAPLAQAGL